MIRYFTLYYRTYTKIENVIMNPMTHHPNSTMISFLPVLYHSSTLKNCFEYLKIIPRHHIFSYVSTVVCSSNRKRLLRSIAIRPMISLHPHNNSVCINLSVMSDSLQPHGLKPSRLLSSWDFPG